MGKKCWCALFLHENSLEKSCAMLATKMDMKKKGCVKLTHNWNILRLDGNTAESEPNTLKPKPETCFTLVWSPVLWDLEHPQHWWCLGWRAPRPFWQAQSIVQNWACLSALPRDSSVPGDMPESLHFCRSSQQDRCKDTLEELCPKGTLLLHSMH